MNKSIFVFVFVVVMLPLLADNSNSREVGSWSGYIYNVETSQPIEGAVVYLSPHFPNSPAEYYNCWVDENGYFEFIDIVAAVYDVRIEKRFYYEYETTKTINEGLNDPTDYYLQRATGCNYSIYFIPDDYWYETTWDLYNEDQLYWYYDANQSFDSGASIRYYVYLEPGNWSIHIWDSFGDGGSWFTLSDINGVTVLEGGCDGSHSEYEFFVPEISGCSCDYPIQYYNVNDPPHLGECNGRQEVWYEFYLENTFTDLNISLAGSNFDTMLELWGNCDDADYLAFNDNWQNEEYSQIYMASLEPGYYYAKIYAPDNDESGYYNFSVTGTPSSVTGDLDGYVFDANNSNPVEGAQIEIELANQREEQRLTAYTDENGYFSFTDLATTTYNILVTKTLYIDYEEQFTIEEGQNSVNIYMEPFTDWTAYLSLSVDSWENEASYNLWDSNNNTWWWENDQTFADEYITHDLWLNLPEGYYEVYCWDSYGDGGISGFVEDCWGITLTSWNSTDYTSEGIFGFNIGSGVFYGDVDANGEVEAYDAANILQYTVGLNPDGVPLPWSELTQMRANVDGNGWIGAYDASLVLMYVNEIITEFPVENMRTVIDHQAQIDVTCENGYLVFNAIGNLYSFSAEMSCPIIDPQSDLLMAVNNNQIALASAFPVSGEFLKIPVTSEQIELSMFINNNPQTITVNGTPKITELNSIYPNPFNPVTTFSYFLDDVSKVKVQIYNIKGQLVKTLVDENQLAGEHKVQWNAVNQASGIYFVKMSSSGYQTTQKIILMK